MKQLDAQGLDDFLVERESGETPSGTFFKGKVTGIRGAFPLLEIQIQKTGEPASDGHWHMCARPGYTPALGDLVDLIKRDDTFSHVLAPLSPNAFVAQGTAQLAPPIVFSSSPATASFSSIPQTFTHLFGSWRTRSSSGTATTLNLRVNDDVSASYDSVFTDALVSPTVFNVSPNLGASSFRVGIAGPSAGPYTSGWFYVLNYARSDNRRVFSWRGWRNDSGGVGTEQGDGTWNNVLAGVNKLTFSTGAATLETGVFQLYGI